MQSCKKFQICTTLLMLTLSRFILLHCKLSVNYKGSITVYYYSSYIVRKLIYLYFFSIQSSSSNSIHSRLRIEKVCLFLQKWYLVGGRKNLIFCRLGLNPSQYEDSLIWPNIGHNATQGSCHLIDSLSSKDHIKGA